MSSNRKDGGGRAVKVHVAAFGKHPGWDDHIEEIGLDCAQLVDAKRVLYTECIGGNVDSGAWEKLDEPRRLPFKHSFYWRTPGGLLIGRMWASRDGKGRTKYPMIVCALVEGVSDAWAVANVLPRLVAAEEKCAGTGSAELVRLAIGEARRGLEDAAAVLVGGESPGDTGASLLTRLVNHPSLGGGGGEKRLGLVRVLYEVQRELAGYKRTAGTPSSIGKLPDEAAQHLRVPKGLEGPGEAARAWIALLDQEVSPATPVLVIEPDGQRFLDLIIGNPRAGQFFCARAGEAASGLTSDVPYTMDPTIKARAEAKIAAWSRGEVEFPSGDAGLRGSRASGDEGRRWPRLVLMGIAALLTVLAVVWAVKAGMGTGKPEPSQPKPAHTAKTGTPPAPMAEGPTQKTGAVPAGGVTAGVPEPAGNAGQPSDPRGTWALDSGLAGARHDLDTLTGELAVEGQRPDEAMVQQLDQIAQRAGALRAAPWSAEARQKLTQDMGALDAQLAQVQKSLETGLGGGASRVRASLAERAKTAPVQSELMKRAWISGIDAIDGRAGWAASRARADALEAALKGAEASIGGVAPVEPPAGSVIDAGTLRAAVADKRDQALRDAADAAVAGDSARARDAVDQFKAWSQDAAAVVKTAQQMEALLSSSAPAAEHPTLDELAAAAQALPAYREVGPAILPVLRQAEVSRTLSAETSPAALIDAVKGAASDTGGRRVPEMTIAWRRLAQVGWPSQASELAEAALLQSGPIKAAVEGISDQARAQVIGADLGATGEAMWARFVRDHGTEDAELGAALAARGPMGVPDVDVQSLPAWARFNLLRKELGDAAAHAETLTADAKSGAQRAGVEEFVKSVEALPGVAAEPGVASLIAQLRPFLAKGTKLDLATLGPGGAGWKLVPGEGPDTVRYTLERAGATDTIQFKPVGGGGGGGGSGGAAEETVTFLATNELTVGIFIATVTTADKWEDFRPLLASYPPAGDDIRRGPRVWQWSTKPGEVMRVALPGPGDTSHGWLRSKSTTAGRDYYPPGLSVDAPSPQHPMQYISPTAAALTARLLGCRLPTSAEWKAAAAVPQPTPPNLRDPTWKKQFEWSREQLAFGPEFPGGGIFWPAEAQKIPSIQDGTPATDADDGVLWFSPAVPGPGFHNLEGNVAEFVWETPGTLETAEATPAAVKSALGKGEDLRVIGGSALSAKDVNPMEPQAVNFPQAREGFSDVGFRLAFTAPKGATAGAGVKLEQALAAPAYLRPGAGERHP